MSVTQWARPFRADDPAGSGVLPVSEQFGPTIQGEGRHAGLAVQFLRLGGCNLSCTWCDTPYTWDASRYDLKTELTMTPARELVAAATPGLPVVLSGGEPLMHQGKEQFEYLLQGLGAAACAVHVETNGTLIPNPAARLRVAHFTVSPKLGHAGGHKPRQDPAIDWAGWGRLAHKTDMKFVVRDGADVQEVADLVDAAGWPRYRTYVMPLGTSTGELQDRWPGVASAAASLHLNACHRTHVLAWGDTKGT